MLHVIWIIVEKMDMTQRVSFNKGKVKYVHYVKPRIALFFNKAILGKTQSKIRVGSHVKRFIALGGCILHFRQARGNLDLWTNEILFECGNDCKTAHNSPIYNECQTQ